MEYQPTNKIAILGGTGKEGKGLAYRWAKSGFQVFIGSRTPEKAMETAYELSRMLSGNVQISGTSNIDAATRADIIVITVPYSAHRDTIESIAAVVKGKVLIDVTVPLVPPKLSKVQMPPAGSAAQEAHQILGEDTQVTAAFHNISHEKLMRDEQIDCEVLVTGTSKNARQEILNLVKAAGLIGWDAGPIENSVVVEGMTSVLIGINKEYGSSSAGIRITGVKPSVQNP
jgi:hypothetical protein